MESVQSPLHRVI